MLAIVTQDQWDELWNALPPQKRKLEMTSNGVQCQVVPTQHHGGVLVFVEGIEVTNYEWLKREVEKWTTEIIPRKEGL